MNIGMFAMQKQFDVLESFVDNFQQINMKIRTSKIPVVVAHRGMFLEGVVKLPCTVMQEFMQQNLILD